MSIYVYVAVMAVTTYLIRAIPLTLMKKPIRSRFLRSFLHYVPYACLTAMTFPAILTSTATLLSGTAALIVAIAARREQEVQKKFSELERVWEKYNVYEKQEK